MGGPQRCAAQYPPLFLAALQGAPRSTVDLLAAKGADVGWADGSGRVALHMAAGGGHAEVVRALGGTHVAALDARGFGYTPLHMAALGTALLGRTAAARALRELGADASLRDQEGKTALAHAEAEGKHEVVQLLHDHAAQLLFAHATIAEADRMMRQARESAAAVEESSRETSDSPTPRSRPTPASASNRTATAPTRGSRRRRRQRPLRPLRRRRGRAASPAQEPRPGRVVGAAAADGGAGDRGGHWTVERLGQAISAGLPRSCSG